MCFEKHTDQDYEVVCRAWYSCDNCFIRGWTIDEYVNVRPEQEYILNVKIGEDYSDEKVHCKETRRYWCIGKNGRKLISFDHIYDYSINEILV